MSTPAPATKRRGQAIAGALSGLAVVVVLVVVFIAVKASDSHKATPAAAQAPASQAAAQPEPTAPASEPAAPATADPGPVNTPAALTKEPVVKGGSGTVAKLKATVLVAGQGPVVQKGQTVTANYVLVAYKTGKVIDSSWKRGQPFSTPIGTGAVIQGWDQGIPGQKVGSRIQLDVPAALAYGPQQGDLRFVVDILAAK